MSVESIREANPNLVIRDSADPALAAYGRLIDPKPFIGLVDLADAITDIYPLANTYVANLPEFELDASIGALRLHFGLVDIQIGYCNGPNSRLNAAEWHKSSEIDIAVTDLLLFLGKRHDIDGSGYIDSDRFECFYIAKGEALEILPEVLHFAPCKVLPEGFKSIIVLPRGTNEPLSGQGLPETSAESRFLYMKNKWLIAHPERKALVERGAFPGIRGENIEIALP